MHKNFSVKNVQITSYEDFESYQKVCSKILITSLVMSPLKIRVSCLAIFGGKNEGYKNDDF